MFYANRYTPTRTRIFRLFLLFSAITTLVYLIVAGQLVIHAEKFHQTQLARQLIEEGVQIEALSGKGSAVVDELLHQKQRIGTPYIYQFLEQKKSSQQYAPGRELNSNTQLTLTDGRLLMISIKPEILEAYRQTLYPLFIGGTFLPLTLFLLVAFMFAVQILNKLQLVNSAINRVICGEKRVKIPLAATKDEFDILAIHLNFLIEQMEKNEVSLKTVTTGLAHDMRTPLGRIKLRLEELYKQVPAELRDDIERCESELELTLSMFNSMLEIESIKTGQHVLNASRVCMYDLAEDAISYLLPVADAKAITFVLRSDAPCYLWGDKTLLFRAVLNLVDNAVKYTPYGGHIEVVIDMFGLVVADTGRGLDSDEWQQVTKPMYRGDKSRNERGLGLGLALVEAICARHGLKLVFYDNKPGLRVRILIKSGGGEKVSINNR